MIFAETKRFLRWNITALFSCVACLWVGCSESSEKPLFPEDEISEEMELKLSGWKVDSLDTEKLVVRVSPTKGWLDSLVIDSLALPGSSALYLAADDDLVDPALGEKLVPGTVISTKDTNQFSVVALDSYNRIAGVWLVVWKLPETPKSSDSKADSSSDAKPSSSESADSADSSGENKSSESSSDSSSGESGFGGDSSESADSNSSSSEGVVSSSSEAAQPQAVKLADLSVDGGTVQVTGFKVYVEMPYGSDLSSIQLIPLDTTNNLIRPVEMEFEDAEGNVGTYSVVAGVQLPGSDFSARNDFWATTSDAMAEEGNGTYYLSFIPISVTMSSEANAVFEGSNLTIKTISVAGSALNIDGGWKMAGGFYYAGSFTGVNCSSIYQASNEEASADGSPADFSQYMIHGKPFTGRPSAFRVLYKYDHHQNTNETYLQKALIYVVLVSADNKIVAAGSLTEEASLDDWVEKMVKLNYGSDAGLLTAGYTGLSDLSVGTGEEDVASIRVMFASSAFAYVADGGTSSQMKKRFRGGENSSLTLDDFKLIY